VCVCVCLSVSGCAYNLNVNRGEISFISPFFNVVVLRDSFGKICEVNFMLFFLFVCCKA